MSAPDIVVAGTAAPDALPPAPPRPAPAPPRAYRFPRFERRALPNGLGLVVAPVPKLPLVTIVLVAEAGASADAAGREGAAQLVARLLLEGTETLDGAALAERFESLGAAVEASADWDGALVRMTVLASRLGEAFPLFAEAVLAPGFPPREVERLKQERLAELLQLRAEPRGLADEMFDRFLYAPASRYAYPAGGSETSVAALDRGALLGFWRERYRAGGMTLVVAGDVTADAVERLARASFGDLPGGASPPVRVAAEAARLTRAIHVVTKDEAPQSELRVGHVGLPRSHPDYFPVVVMNAVLGGLFSSRINLNLREAHAYTYGAHSGFDWRRAPGPFVVDAAVKSDVTHLAAREVLREIDRMRAEPIAADELSLATSYLDGVFPIRYETTGAIAAALASLVVYGLPDDYFDTYRSRIRGVTTGAVREAAERHLDPARLQMVFVGDPEAIRQPLEGLEFGPVAVYDADGNRTG
ncbi:MAG TPA: pitrilysin family protein [Gemmatimonadaceae bacterium]|nr:pitrilysin family protein [Gemmatimonadaceae bacterium]